MVGSALAPGRVAFAAAGWQTVVFISVESAVMCLFLWLMNSISFMCLVGYLVSVLLVWLDPGGASGGLIKCPGEVIWVRGMSLTGSPLYTTRSEVPACFNVCVRSVCPAVGTVFNAVNATWKWETWAFGLFYDPKSVNWLINENLKIYAAF